jgi:HK97 family phage major capsid protein
MATMTKDLLIARKAFHLSKAKGMLDAWAREERMPTADEEAAHAKELAAVEQLDKQIGDAAVGDAINDVWARQGLGTSGGGRSGGSSAGALFAAGVGDFFTQSGHRTAGGWRSPAVEVPYASMFATTISEAPGSAGKLVVPDYQTGIVPLPTRKLVVMDLLMPGTTDSNVVTYMVETLFTNAAAPVAEGAAKPESALTYDQVPEPVNKIAHWIPVTEETLEDVSGMRSTIDGKLRLGVQLAEDDQLLNGNGTPPNFKGLLLRATAPTVVQGGTENAADAILRQIGAISTNAMKEPTGIVMNPADWYPLQALKTSTGEYIGGSPFGPVIVKTLWGLPVAVTPAIVAKTALVGAFSSQSQFFRKGGIRVEASNSHQDFFIKNLVAIRAEERGALAVYRPGAFGKVTLT